MDKKLLEILVCPVCKAEVKLVKEEIICQKCGRIYPIKNGIPIMLEKEAKIDE
ncbi:MAG: Trm112 family protein [Candidatus Omnitrophica bacterium]|nr:Trm112 family protein [Candidatus Omnitrophota bacterium]MCF7893820.1 Trm112 family protein [Candidatus Omnitrophota bacterium]